MFERVLKTLLAVMLMVFFMHHVVSPFVEKTRNDRARLGEVKGALEHMAENRQNQSRKMLEMEKQMIDAYFSQLNQLIPEFDASRVTAIASIEKLRDEFAGDWEIVPGTQVIGDGFMVRWPVKISYKGSYAAAMSVLSRLEHSMSLNRIQTVDMKAGVSEEVELAVNLEILFRESTGNSRRSELVTAGGAL